MNPDPLYMLMKNMTQRAHGPRPYDGILGASEEKVVAYKDDLMAGLEAGDAELAFLDATAWVKQGGTYRPGDKGTLIEIRVVGTFQIDNDGGLTITNSKEIGRAF